MHSLGTWSLGWLQRPWLRIAAEGVLLLGLLTWLGRQFGYDDRMQGLSPHPYWLVVLLLASKYGTTAGLYAVAAATFFLYYDALPPRALSENPFSYQTRISTLPCLWLITAYLLGQIRSKLNERVAELIESNDRQQKRCDALFDGYAGLLEAKDLQDQQIASQQKTVSSLYRTFEYLEAQSPAKILMALEQIISSAVEPKKFSVFVAGASGFEASTCHGWKDSDDYVRRYPTEHPLFQAIGVQRRVLCVVNEKDEKILQGEGIIAGPLVDPSNDSLLAMVKIEELVFEDLFLGTLETFQTMCLIVGRAYANARRYRQLEKHSLFSGQTQTLSKETWTQFRSTFEQVAEKGATWLEIKLGYLAYGTHGSEEKAVSALAAHIEDLMPDASRVFCLDASHGKFVAFTPGINQQECEQFQQKLLDRLKEDPFLANCKLHFSTVVRRKDARTTFPTE